MHRFAPVILLLSGLLVSCTTQPVPRLALEQVRTVFVDDTAAAPNLKFEGLSHTVHDTLVRELTRKGYVAASAPEKAQAIMRSTWRPRQAAGLRFDRTDMQLTISLFDQTGHRLFETDTGPGFALGFWNEPRTADEVVKAIGKLPAAQAGR